MIKALIRFLIIDLIRGKASPKGQEALYKKQSSLEVCVSSFPLKLGDEEGGVHTSIGAQEGLSGLGEEQEQAWYGPFAREAPISPERESLKNVHFSWRGGGAMAAHT